MQRSWGFRERTRELELTISFKGFLLFIATWSRVLDLSLNGYVDSPHRLGSWVHKYRVYLFGDEVSNYLLRFGRLIVTWCIFFILFLGTTFRSQYKRLRFCLERKVVREIVVSTEDNLSTDGEGQFLSSPHTTKTLF